jgi:hypothetical protein
MKYTLLQTQFVPHREQSVLVGNCKNRTELQNMLSVKMRTCTVKPNSVHTLS